MNEPTLIDYGKVIGKRKAMIACVVVIATALSVVVSFLLPKTYKSEVSLFPMGGQKSGLAAMASQSGLGSLLGAVGGAGANPSVQIMAILKSRTLAERVINKCDLMKVLFDKSWDASAGTWKEKDPEKQPHMEDAVKALFTHVTFDDDKRTQTIVIRSIFKDAQLAATVANEYSMELAKHLGENTFTIAKRNRIFIEGQLERNRADLLDIGKAISSFYSLNKISNTVPMVDVNVKPGDELPATAGADLEEVRKKTEELQNKVQEIRSQLSAAEPEGQVVHDVPQQVYLQYLTLQRELLGQVNALLTQQYEMAKVDEAKDDLNFYVIDKAVVPFRKYGPKRKLIVGGAFVLSFFGAVFAAFFKEYLNQN